MRLGPIELAVCVDFLATVRELRNGNVSETEGQVVIVGALVDYAEDAAGQADLDEDVEDFLRLLEDPVATAGAIERSSSSSGQDGASRPLMSTVEQMKWRVTMLARASLGSGPPTPKWWWWVKIVFGNHGRPTAFEVLCKLFGWDYNRMIYRRQSRE